MPFLITSPLTADGEPQPAFAVSTLVQARERAALQVRAYSGRMPRTWPHPIAQHLAEAEGLGEEGGIIGPMPNHCTIQVHPVTYGDLSVAVWGHTSPMADLGEIIELYNQRQRQQLFGWA